MKAFRRMPSRLTPLLLFALSSPLIAQSCLTASEMDDATRNAILDASNRYFAMTSRGDAASLQQNSIPSLAASFSGIAALVKDTQDKLAGAQATPRPPFLLKADGAAPLERAEFLCGVFGSKGQTANSAIFGLNNLPPGTYAVATLDASSPKGPLAVSFVLQQLGTDWKVGGVYAKALQVAGHDGQWYAARAREFKAKGQTLNAWFYFLEARDLMVPVPFMSTQATDKLYDESQAVKPADLPSADHPVNLVAQAAAPKPNPKPGEQFSNPGAGKTYEMIDLYPTLLGNDLDVVVKYRAADISDTSKAFQDNMAVMKALLLKYPELRDTFNGVVARAVAPSGQDYGSLLAMKDIK